MAYSFVQFKDVSKIYHLGGVDIYALDCLNYSINKGDFTIIAGPSGSGKSTFLNLLGCIDKPTSGNIFFEDRNITHIPLEDLKELRLNKIGFIFQSFNLVPVLTAYENVELPLLFSALSKNEIKDRTNHVLERVGLSDRIHHMPSNLSGGQRQRVAIARALVGQPSLIIADEPTASLDSKNAESVLDLLTKLNEEDQVTIVLASHDSKVISRAKNKLYLSDGKIVEQEQYSV
jgi:putative ABC transport system ATP-binding protein